MIADADPTWPVQAARAAARIERGAAGRLRRLDHIGSTSVPGLAAKDVLDLQVVVDDLDAARSVAADLPPYGLVAMPGRWYDVLRNGTEQDKVMACNGDPARAVNLHVRTADSPAWRDALLLRDWLRASPEGLAEYATVKRRLAGAATYEDINDYAQRKTPWINEALSRAEEWAGATGWSATLDGSR